MGFLYLLEDMRFHLLDLVMLLITRLGEETIFLAVAMILFWCVDKYQGYYLMSVGFFGTMFNQFLKLLCRVPRPWVLDPEFTIVEQAREAASGYSFPSGHSQSAVGTFGCLAITVKQKWLRIICVVIAVLVPFSRMYLGVHTPQDVLVGSAMAVAMIFLFRPVSKGKGMHILLPVMIVLNLAYLCFVECYPFPSDMDPYNLASGQKNAYTLLGALVGITVVYIIDEKKMHFDVRAVWWAQLLKIGFGLLLVLGVKSGLKAPLETLFQGHLIARGIRYFLIVVVAGTLWPLTFPWFARLGNSVQEES